LGRSGDQGRNRSAKQRRDDTLAPQKLATTQTLSCRNFTDLKTWQPGRLAEISMFQNQVPFLYAFLRRSQLMFLPCDTLLEVAMNFAHLRRWVALNVALAQSLLLKPSQAWG